MKWQQKNKGEKRRYGTLFTRKGSISTPFFMPDATRAAVRGVLPQEIRSAGIEALVVNTYHLFLQPGETLIARAGGVHQFMDWDGPILSDSGGYQVYSLIHRHPEMGRVTEEGAEFKSVLDGSKKMLTPERALQIQFDLGVDMMVVLDDPRPNDAPENEVLAAVDRTTMFAERSKKEYDRQCQQRGFTEATRPLLFGVVQGGVFPDLRERSAKALCAMSFDGYGFGGRHIDGEGNFLEDIVSHTASLLPDTVPRFALGVGTPKDIVRFFSAGWDMFDCVIPTREGRHGRLFVWKDTLTIWEDDFYETINITNEQYTEDFSSIDSTCDCELCTRHTRAYLRHLFKVSDPLALRLASLHNVRFYARLMERLREEKENTA
ncbi:MAG: tRNA guanosine(34) transglycosylase Tgt [Candidatus Moranbacteria bacterium]|nr:tRNA guanosine(34) transglycosylase Tgt [Candidatus Moranbacteria bacterium]